MHYIDVRTTNCLERGNQEQHSAARRDAPVRCAVCGRTVPRASRQQKFCSTRCRKRHAREENGRTAIIFPGLSQHSGNGTNPPKKANGFNALQAAKTGSSPRIHGPRQVIERELFAGHDWTPIVSPDGVVCMVAARRRT